MAALVLTERSPGYLTTTAYMLINMTMIMVNIFEAKAKLSEFLNLAARGERVVICKRNRPVAELHGVLSARTEPRPIGLARGHVSVPDAFFESLPDEMLDAFEGLAPSASRMRVAEDQPDDGLRGTRGTRGTRGARRR